MEKIKLLIQKLKDWRETRKFTVTCPTCRQPFNARIFSGLCPHDFTPVYDPNEDSINNIGLKE